MQTAWSCTTSAAGPPLVILSFCSSEAPSSSDMHSSELRKCANQKRYKTELFRPLVAKGEGDFAEKKHLFSSAWY